MVRYLSKLQVCMQVCLIACSDTLATCRCFSQLCLIAWAMLVCMQVCLGVWTDTLASCRCVASRCCEKCCLTSRTMSPYIFSCLYIDTASSAFPTVMYNLCTSYTDTQSSALMGSHHLLKSALCPPKFSSYILNDVAASSLQNV